MEWVQTTGSTVDEAKDRALDSLGVDETDAEIEVVEEPTKGLFGRTRGQATVRARVRPTTPAPKQERRRRGSKPKPKGGGRSRGSGTTSAGSRDKDRPKPKRGAGGRPRADRGSAPTGDGTTGTDARSSSTKENDVTITTEDQATQAAEFLAGLAEAFGASATTTVEMIEDDLAEVSLDGEGLQPMVGSGGGTLAAIHELSKVVVQRRSEGQRAGRFRIDIGGYRARRRVALGSFATSVAQDVISDGEPRALEPMGAADRKVVHDTVNEIDGVSTRSDGEEPRRRVVIIADEVLDVDEVLDTDDD